MRRNNGSEEFRRVRLGIGENEGERQLVHSAVDRVRDPVGHDVSIARRIIPVPPGVVLVQDGFEGRRIFGERQADREGMRWVRQEPYEERCDRGGGEERKLLDGVEDFVGFGDEVWDGFVRNYEVDLDG